MSIDQVSSPTVALVGSPNSGKTTLFNWLTGSKVKTVNYAGSTVDSHHGMSLPIYGAQALRILDTPGVYSLQPHGRDEEVTLQTLTGDSQVQAVIVVMDGTQLNRQLYLVRQIQELRLPMVLALTMMDIVEKSGRRLDLIKLAELTGAQVIPVDGRLGGGVEAVVQAARGLATAAKPRLLAKIDWDDQRIEKEIAVAETWTRQVVTKSSETEALQYFRRWDRYFLHPVWGLPIFVLIMSALFSSVFSLAAPLMDFVDWFFGALAQGVFSALGPSALSDFMGNGVVAGIGAVMVFVPQIFILFFGFTLLEDSGYLARAATIVDRPLHRIGLSGRAFVPILSGFACAVPAIMACRNIRSPRERWITVFIIPFMTCSARLPVYALLLTFLFYGDSAWKAGPALTGLYLVGVMIGALAAALLNRVLKVTADSHFLMELPIYRVPKLGFTFRTASRRTLSYVRRAGPTIFFFVLLLWVGTHFPYRPEVGPAQQLEQSVVGRMGHAIAPVFAPMGLDWRAGLGMMSAFVAREVFVSSLAVIFSVASDPSAKIAEASIQNSLLEKMREARLPDGSLLFTTASVTALIVFFMLALQCISTTGVAWREMGSWRYAAVQLVTLNALAYAVAVLVAQVLSHTSI